MTRARLRLVCSLVATILGAAAVLAQPKGPTPASSAPPAQVAPKDSLGRDTPRGTVLGFMAAGRKGTFDAAALYLDTNLKGPAAADLVRKLFVVLDTRLPVRLNELSDRPEGSLADPLHPDRDVVGDIVTDSGRLDLVLSRVSRGSSPPVWLFSRETLDAIPSAFDEVHLVSIDRFVPAVLKIRLAGIRLFEWLLVLLGVPFCYRLLEPVGRSLGRIVARWRRTGGSAGPNLMPGPVRLALLALGMLWIRTHLDLPLVERRFWGALEALLVTAAIVWTLLLLNGFFERYFRRQLQHTSFSEATPLLRFGRRVADVLVVAAGCIGIVRFFGFDPTAALAGLGIGGVAIALAAQKTLENVIAGVSIILDRAVEVGDVLKVGDTTGTVESIGLRSTRIRTAARTTVSLPNGQIATVGIENLSTRDKFRVNHIIGLRYETTAAQMREVVDGFRNFLERYPGIEAGSIWVRFVRLGSFSLDIEVSAYLFAADWDRFLDVQQELLLGLMEVVEKAGTRIAIPSQTLQITDGRAGAAAAVERVTAVRQPAPSSSVGSQTSA
jgi:MscS family membrane protein